MSNDEQWKEEMMKHQANLLHLTNEHDRLCQQTIPLLNRQQKFAMLIHRELKPEEQIYRALGQAFLRVDATTEQLRLKNLAEQTIRQLQGAQEEKARLEREIEANVKAQQTLIASEQQQ